jgi:hypothetical protein
MQVLAKGQLVDDLAAVGAFLPEPLGHIALLVVGLEGGFFENGHGSELARLRLRPSKK